jgi:hypothetical protein
LCYPFTLNPSRLLSAASSSLFRLYFFALSVLPGGVANPGWHLLKKITCGLALSSWFFTLHYNSSCANLLKETRTVSPSFL